MNSKLHKLLHSLSSLSTYPQTSSTNHQQNHKILQQSSITKVHPIELQKIYPSVTIQNIIQEFQEYLLLPSEMRGKRCSEITVSKNRKYCCKYVDEESIKKYISFANQLIEHSKKGQSTYLLQIYRIFKVESKKQNLKQTDIFMIMPCLIPDFNIDIMTYDIKGHCESRAVNAKDLHLFKFGKDQNFVGSKEQQIFRKVDLKVRERVLEILRRDVKFLESKGVIDYSLLINFRKQTNGKDQSFNQRVIFFGGFVIEMAIVDYFQQYNLKKKAENKIKSFFKTDISSVEPQIYSSRFLKFIIQHFFVQS